MKSFRIDAPSIQNWSCHGCTFCCRELMAIEISDAEKRRIEGQGWTQSNGVDPEKMFVAENGQFRLGHQSDGTCVFLDPAGKCRIHSRFGEAAKPRACRLYPLTFHPTGRKLLVGVRFSCPSAAAHSGQALSAQMPALTELAKMVVPEGFEELPPPAILQEDGLDWPDFTRFVFLLDKTLATENQPVGLKLRRALHWLGAVEKAGFDKISGREADEILGALAQNAAAELPTHGAVTAPPTKIGRLLFRTLVFTYARRDPIHPAKPKAAYRLRMLAAMIRFAKASGQVPNMRPGLKEVEFSAVEKCPRALPSGGDATLTRFFRVKIQSMHFCGRAFYGKPLIEGFHHLALLYPVILWLARWQAAAEQRAGLSELDVERAVSLVDHHHGYSPVLASGWSRQRVRLMAHRDDISRLCAAYAS